MIGSKLGPYEIREEIGRGGNGGSISRLLPDKEAPRVRADAATIHGLNL
jgi:hypothetical protein